MDFIDNYDIHKSNYDIQSNYNENIEIKIDDNYKINGKNINHEHLFLHHSYTYTYVICLDYIYVKNIITNELTHIKYDIDKKFYVIDAYNHKYFYYNTELNKKHENITNKNYKDIKNNYNHMISMVILLVDKIIIYKKENIFIIDKNINKCLKTYYKWDFFKLMYISGFFGIFKSNDLIIIYYFNNDIFREYNNMDGYNIHLLYNNYVIFVKNTYNYFDDCGKIKKSIVNIFDLFQKQMVKRIMLNKDINNVSIDVFIKKCLIPDRLLF